jgi:hypothetical protein
MMSSVDAATSGVPVADSGLMPHEVDRHLVAGGIYLNRVDRELEKIPTGLVPEERQEVLSSLRGQLTDVIVQLEELRTGRKRTKRPKTLAEVTDLDRYRKDFIEEG